MKYDVSAMAGLHGLDSENSCLMEQVQKYDAKRHFPLYELVFLSFFLPKLELGKTPISGRDQRNCRKR